MGLASVFAGQTRTNQPSCATATVTGTPIRSAMSGARKNGRIGPPALLSLFDYVDLPPDGRASRIILRIQTVTLPGNG